MNKGMPLEDLFREWRACTEERRCHELREQIIEQARPFALARARRFAHRGEPLEDLESQALIGLIKAVDRYDPYRDAKFFTFAQETIEGEIRRYFRDHGWALKVPRRVQDLVLRVRKVSQELERSIQRQPSVIEIASAMRVREEDVLEAMEASGGYDTLSWEGEVLAGFDGEEDGLPLQDSIGAEDDSLERYERRQWLEEALQSLEPRQRYIIERRYFGEASQSEVARELNISQMHVSRLERRAIENLRRFLKESEEPS